MQNCVKCNKIRTDCCNSLGPPRQMFLTKPQCHNRANSCSMRALYHPCTSSNLLNNMVHVFMNTGNTLPPSNLRTPFGARHESTALCRWGVFQRGFSGIPKQRGTKSEVAASPLPSRGPERGRKCYVTPAFWGSPTRVAKSEVKTYARGYNDAPSISKYGSLVQPNAQIAALR